MVVLKILVLATVKLSLSQDIADVAKAQMTWVGEWNEEESDLELEEFYTFKAQRYQAILA